MDPRRRTLRRIMIEERDRRGSIFQPADGTEVGPRRDFIVGGAAELDPSRIDTCNESPYPHPPKPPHRVVHHLP